jgi:xanthine dehydrogenase YagS FAD-binding subunit
MIRFEYVSPNSVKQALGLLSANWGEAEILAGGTDLLALMKDYVVTPKRVVNIKQLPGMHAISAERDGLRIGALVTLDRIADAAQIRRDYPALAQCVADAASPQIRNMATIGGNLCQRPRCWYFRNGMARSFRSFGFPPPNHLGWSAQSRSR